MERINNFIQNKLEPNDEQEYLTLLFNSYYNAESIKKWELTLSEKHNLSRITRKRFSRRSLVFLITSGIAACLTALVMITSLNPQNAQTFALKILAEDDLYHPDVVKGNSSKEVILMDAARAFNQQQYQAAVDLYTARGATNLLSEKDLYFQGLSYLKLGDYQKSENILLRLTESSIYREEARWYYSLSLLLGEKHSEAKHSLDLINTDEWNYSRAKKLSKKIK